MALLQECPKCHRKFSMKRKTCTCGFRFEKASGKVYWIEYYLDGRKRRERMGTNKAAAEHRLREVLSRRAEGRVVKKIKDPTFDELKKWYLDLPQIKNKKSYDKIKINARNYVLRKFDWELIAKKYGDILNSM